MNVFEIECLNGRVSCPCIVDAIVGDSVRWKKRTLSTNFGLTFERFDNLEQLDYDSKSVLMLLPSSSMPSVRSNYKGFDKIQVACVDSVWLNAMVVLSSADRLYMTVRLETSDARPLRVKRSSVRMRDWFMLHECCRSSVFMFLFVSEQIGFAAEIAIVIAIMVWESRDDREWLEEFQD